MWFFVVTGSAGDRVACFLRVCMIGLVVGFVHSMSNVDVCYLES